MIEVKGDTAYVFLDGDLDVATMGDVGERIHLALGLHVVRIVLDLSAVTFLDASGIRAIVTGYHDTVRAGAGFTIGPTADRIAPILELTGLHGLAAEPGEHRARCAVPEHHAPEERL